MKNFYGTIIKRTIDIILKVSKLFINVRISRLLFHFSLLPLIPSIMFFYRLSICFHDQNFRFIVHVLTSSKSITHPLTFYCLFTFSELKKERFFFNFIFPPLFTWSLHNRFIFGTILYILKVFDFFLEFFYLYMNNNPYKGSLSVHPIPQP